MLQEKFEEEQPAAQVRVSAQELAEAVSAVEQRKGLHGQPTDSIALGEAVDQLGLTVSPEELLAEIKSKQIHQQKLASERRIRTRKRLLVTLVSLLILSVFANIYFVVNWSPAASVAAGPVAIQTGTFKSVQGQEGEIKFPEPYRQAPNVELNSFTNTIITDTTSTGFHWRNSGGSTSDSGDVSWTSRGVK